MIDITQSFGPSEGDSNLVSRAQRLFEYLPGLDSLRNYNRNWLRNDLVAGVVVFAVLIPSNLAYGELAGFTPVVGLYAGFVAMLIYALFSRSRQIIIGPESTTAILMATTVAPMAMGDYARYSVLAASIAILIGTICLVAGRFKLGFVSDFFSKPILTGYITGTSLIVVISQIGKFFGISLSSDDIFLKVIEILTKLDQTHIITLVFGIITLTILIMFRLFAPRMPGPLIVIIGAIIVSTVMNLSEYGVAIVGEITGGLPSFQIPIISFSDFQTIFPAAIAISIILFTDGTLTARVFAKKNHYSLDSNKELIAFGAANVCTGLFQAFPVGASQTKSAVNNDSGNKTQLSGIIAAGLVILFLLFFTSILHNLPMVALGAIIIMAGVSLIDIGEFKSIYHARRSEFYLAILTLIGVLVFGLIQGVALAVGFSLLEFIKRVYRPHTSILGIQEGVDGFHGIALGGEKYFFPGLVVYSFDAPLFFANASFLVTDIRDIIRKSEEPIRYLLIDASAIPDIDTSAADTFKELHEELLEQGITVGISGANDLLLGMIQKTGIEDIIGREYLFPTIRAGIIAFGEKYLDCSE
ncbi:MAG TPA: solute carrier family 26 protein [Methanospirillum sp.]|nr:solute carrier family 26 protein [Methanospirillum sp.]